MKSKGDSTISETLQQLPGTYKTLTSIFGSFPSFSLRNRNRLAIAEASTVVRVLMAIVDHYNGRRRLAHIRTASSTLPQIRSDFLRTMPQSIRTWSLQLNSQVFTLDRSKRCTSKCMYMILAVMPFSPTATLQAKAACTYSCDRGAIGLRKH